MEKERNKKVKLLEENGYYVKENTISRVKDNKIEEVEVSSNWFESEEDVDILNSIEDIFKGPYHSISIRPIGSI